MAMTAVARETVFALRRQIAKIEGTLPERLTVGLILGNRNVGLVWSALGAAASPRMALYFAATQFPIYILPRLIETLIGRDTRKAKP